MKIVHIFSGGNYEVMKNYIRFLSENFVSDHHHLICIDSRNNVPQEILDYSHIEVLDLGSLEYYKKIMSSFYKYDKVILHSLCLNIYTQLSLLFLPNILKKIFWVSWGMDMYQWKRNDTNILYNIKNSITFKFRKNIKHFVGIFPPDIDYFKKEFKSNANTYYASYIAGMYEHLFKKELKLITLEDKINSKSAVNIMIGHSSATILNHIEVLETLKKFKCENIKIHLPLNYGDMTYGDSVEKRAIEIFGNKANCIRTKMNKDKYLDFLTAIDIAIFNTPRQIGLGNLIPLFFMKKKVYLPEGSIMYEYYRSIDIPLPDYNKISSMTFKEFIAPFNMSKVSRESMRMGTDLKNKIEMWKNVFTGKKYE